MQGIIYFGVQSLNASDWKKPEDIFNDIDQISDIVEMINDSNHSSVKVPHNWFDENSSCLDFWQKLQEICGSDHQLFGNITQELFDKALNNCIDKDSSFDNVVERVQKNNPSRENTSFYGVIKTINDWQSVSSKYHVKSESDLYDLVVSVLAENPIGESNYARLSKCVFSNLEFHDDFKDTLSTHGATSQKSAYSSPSITGIDGFSSPTTSSLRALNDVDLSNKSTAEILSELAAKSGFECTPEGSDKGRLRYTFNYDEDTFDVNCEFHIKISQNNSKDGVYYQDRIYFGFYTLDQVRRVFVAHSGCHL